MIDTTPRDGIAPEPEPAGDTVAAASGPRAVLRWVALLVLSVVLPMVLLSTTVAAHAEGCGGG